MKCLDLTLPTPAENLACDEALLDWCEEEYQGEILRFWEPREHFVVVGYANKVALEVNAAACAARGISIYRRCSGGGTVLQGPGCLNYSLVLKADESGPLHSIVSANRFVMERNRAAIEALSFPSEIEARGHTDLVLGGRKFSGNAQRRKKRFLLFHGTFLLRFDLALIETILPMPSRQPRYRRNRAHADFLMNLDVPVNAVKRSLCRAWGAAGPLEGVPREAIASLTRDRYATTEWIFKF